MPFDFQGLAKNVGAGAKGFAANMGSHIGGGLALGTAAAATAAVGVAAHKAYEGLTQRRDFRRMMTNPFNTDLKEHHDRDPASFNAAFSGLRDANYELSANPMTAGAYMRRMLTVSPEAAGGILVEARSNQLDNASPVRDAFQRAGIMGAQASFQEHLRDQGELAREKRMPKLEAEKLKETYEDRLKMEKAKLMETYGDRMKMEKAKLDYERDSTKVRTHAYDQQKGRNQADLLHQEDLHRQGFHPYQNQKKPLPRWTLPWTGW